MRTEGFKFWREKLNGAKFVVAPMVDQSELAWRMMSRNYGAQLCYTPMMHAAVFVRDPTYRAENFVTCPEDRPLIAQFCSDDPDTFLKAAKFIENECDAIDINLGCPQNIAKRGHYGAFLQDEWDLIHDIIDNLKIPVTAKIRVFEDIQKSVEYAKMIEKAGAALITVHGRTREQKGVNTGLASWKHIKAIKEAVKIPVFANGNILCFNDVLACMRETGCDGVMIAEPNLYNPALFTNQHPNAWQMAIEYIDYVRKYPCSFTFIRGHLFKMFHKIFERHLETRDKLAKIKEIDKLQEVFDEIRDLCLKDKEKLEKSSEESDGATKSTIQLPYWTCQAYIRPDPLTAKQENQSIKRELESQESSDLVSTSSSIKRHLNELASELNDGDLDDASNNEQAKNDRTKKMLKILERKRRKLEKFERKQNYVNHMKLKFSSSSNQTTNMNNNNNHHNFKPPAKYVDCNSCKNPRGEHCEHGLCRKCCKEKVFTEEIECKGHRLKFRSKQPQEQQQQQTADIK